MAKPLLFLDPFAHRQFDDPNYAGTHINFDKDEFLARMNKIVDEHPEASKTPHPLLVEGYAPFCKHIFVENFVGARVAVLGITPENQHLLKTGYKARTDKELPVLSRWFPREQVEAPAATHLDVILYSREQIELERKALGDNSPVPDAPWGIISIKAQSESYETPMQPITMMRNALGKEEGGSGVSLDRQKYQASVDYWQNRAPIV